MALAYSRFSPEVRAEVQAEYLESVKAYRGEDGYRIPGEFEFVVGRKGS